MNIIVFALCYAFGSFLFDKIFNNKWNIAKSISIALMLAGIAHFVFPLIPSTNKFWYLLFEIAIIFVVLLIKAWEEHKIILDK